MNVDCASWSVTVYVRAPKVQLGAPDTIAELDPGKCEIQLVLRSLVMETREERVEPEEPPLESLLDSTGGKQFCKIMYFDYSGAVSPQKLAQAKDKVKAMMRNEQGDISENSRNHFEELKLIDGGATGMKQLHLILPMWPPPCLGTI